MAFNAIHTNPQLANRFEPTLLRRWTLTDEYPRLLEVALPTSALRALPRYHWREILGLCEGTIGEIFRRYWPALRSLRSSAERSRSRATYVMPADTLCTKIAAVPRRLSNRSLLRRAVDVAAFCMTARWSIAQPAFPSDRNALRPGTRLLNNPSTTALIVAKRRPISPRPAWSPMKCPRMVHSHLPAGSHRRCVAVPLVRESRRLEPAHQNQPA